MYTPDSSEEQLTPTPLPLPSRQQQRTVTPVGNKPGQIPREVIEEAEAAEDLGDDEILAGSPSDWDFDDSTEDGEKVEARRAEELGDEDENPPTPILDAYERSRDPVEMERLIKMSFDSLPERAGPQRYNHKRREQQRWKTIRVSELTSSPVYRAAQQCLQCTVSRAYPSLRAAVLAKYL